MSFSRDFEINSTNFSKDGMESIQSQYFIHENWPVVYILKDQRTHAYVGETIDANARILAHLQNGERKQLKEAYFISSKKFNKSATLDIESNLIKYLHADGQFKLLNGNLGLVNHSYFQRKEYYWELFREIWNGLISKGIARHSIEHIDNSDIFKYSPYKTLSGEQRKNLLMILDAILTENKKSILVEGGAGTGKTILAIFLFKLILSTDSDFNYAEFGPEEELFASRVKALKQKHPKPKMALVISMGSFRKTMQKVFDSIQGLDSSMVIGPSDLEFSEYDILFIDEAHRLRKRVNLGPYFSVYDRVCKALHLDKLNTSELEWTQLRSRKAIYFYDEKQTVKPSDVDAFAFEQLKHRQDSIYILLQSQFRVKGGNGYVKFVNQLLDHTFEQKEGKYQNDNYDVLLFDRFADFVEQVREKNKLHGLCRFIAGYAWEWKSKNNYETFDMEIEGIQMKWNSKNSEYILWDVDAKEVGCIHTTQGYDLNYAGIIFGPEITYNTQNGEIEIKKENYKDKAGSNTIRDVGVLKNFIINIYKTIMLRGILGCYVYVCDENLREYFRKHLSVYQKEKAKENQESIELNSRIIPFVNSVPLYSLQVAAGDFFRNEEYPEEHFILVPEHIRISKNHFACRVKGNSMNKIVEDGQIALFKWYEGGSRNGLFVIAEYYGLQDNEYGSCYTFKEYYSRKNITEEGYKHETIVLKPRSYDDNYKEITIESDDLKDKSFTVRAVFVQVLE